MPSRIGTIVFAFAVFAASRAAAAEPSSDLAIACYQAFAGSDDERAMNRCSLAAEAGDPDALVKLATLYAQGRGTQRDLDASIEALRQAALNGHAEAQYNLASAYQFGQGLELDLEKARTWYERAAELGHGRAQRNLAAMYELGTGVEADLGIAARWYLASAESGVADSQLKIGLLLWEGDGVGQDRESAQYWIREAAMAGDTDAQFVAGAISLEDDRAAALAWWRRAADRDHVQAMYHLAEQLAEASPSAEDLAAAERYAESAVRAGHAEADALHRRILTLEPTDTPQNVAAAVDADAGRPRPPPPASSANVPDGSAEPSGASVAATSAIPRSVALDASWLRTRDGDNYTLQLGFSSSLPGIRGLITRYGIEDDAHIYATMRGNDLVFMLVYGEYASHAEATAAATALRREKGGIELFVQRIETLQERFEAPRTDVSHL